MRLMEALDEWEFLEVILWFLDLRWRKNWILTNFSHWKLIKNQKYFFHNWSLSSWSYAHLEQLHSLFTLGLVAWATLMNTNINFNSFNWMWFSFIPKYMLKGLGFSNQQCCSKISELWTRSLNHCCFSLKFNPQCGI
jgi:hypothetical protein